MIPLLQEAGHEAIAVDLPGDDPSAGLPEYTRLVTSAIGDRRNVVLVAQSGRVVGQHRMGPGFQQALARDRLGIEADVLPGGHLIALAQPARLASYLLSA